jgi:hypothetical protein
MSQALEAALPRLSPRTTKSGNVSPWPLESALAVALADAMAAMGVPRSRIGMVRRYIEHDWSPPPGGLDLYVSSDVEGALVVAAELKLEEVPQAMWDLYKLMAARKLPGSPETYLVMGAHDACWSKPCGELFPARVGDSCVLRTLDLFRSNQRQYAKDLEYSGRVVSVPTSVRTEAVAAGLRPRHYPHLEFRVAAVRPADPAPIRCRNGWPEGTAP